MRPPLHRAQASQVPTEGRSTDPRAFLAAAIAAVAGADDLDSSLDAVLAAAVEALHPTMAAIFIADPDRAGLQLVAVSRTARVRTIRGQVVAESETVITDDDVFALLDADRR